MKNDLKENEGKITQIVGPVVDVGLDDAARALVAADVREDRVALFPLAEHRGVVGRRAAGVVPDDDVAADQ